mgnify:CR=1 FL=1
MSRGLIVFVVQYADKQKLKVPVRLPDVVVYVDKNDRLLKELLVHKFSEMTGCAPFTLKIAERRAGNNMVRVMCTTMQSGLEWWLTLMAENGFDVVVEEVDALDIRKLVEHGVPKD